MADVQLRGAERASAQSRSDEARARVLVERIRAGKLSRENVELASYAGDHAAILVAGCPLGSWRGDLDELLWRVAERVEWRGALVSGLARAAELELLTETIERRRAWMPAVHAARVWAGCPCREHYAANLQVLREARRADRGDGVEVLAFVNLLFSAYGSFVGFITHARLVVVQLRALGLTNASTIAVRGLCEKLLEPRC